MGRGGGRGGGDNNGGSRGGDQPGRTTSTGHRPHGDPDGDERSRVDRALDGYGRFGERAKQFGEDSTNVADGVSDTIDAGKKVADSVGSIGDGSSGKGSGAGQGSGGGGLDTLNDTTDPLGGLASGGVGWLIEHVAFLREPLDYLTGDPGAIKQHARHWQDVAEQLTALGEQRKTGARGTSDWQGEAADCYRQTAGNQTEAIRTAASAAENLAGQVLAAGEFLGTVRQLVKDLIAAFVEALVGRALVAAALAVETLGASVAAFIASAVAEAAAVATRCVKEVTKAIEVLGLLSQGLQALGGALEGISEGLGKVRAGAGAAH